MRKYTYIFISLVILSAPMLALAQGSFISCAGDPVNCKWSDLIKTANNLINFMFRLAIGLASISVAYAGFLYLTAEGDTGQIKQAHGVFIAVVKGFIIMMSAWLVVKLLLRLAGPEYSLLE